MCLTLVWSLPLDRTMTLDAGWPLSRVGRCRNSSDCHTPYLRIMGRADRHPPVQEAGARPQGDESASYAVMLPSTPRSLLCEKSACNPGHEPNFPWPPPILKPDVGSS